MPVLRCRETLPDELARNLARLRETSIRFSALHAREHHDGNRTLWRLSWRSTVNEDHGIVLQTYSWDRYIAVTSSLLDERRSIRKPVGIAVALAEVTALPA